MTESRWRNWSSGTEVKKGFSSFVSESLAAAQAEKLGLVAAPFGRWRDPQTGEVVAKTVGDKLQMIRQATAADQSVDMGNPTAPGSGLSPADRAQQLGLQSDGSGGYVDQEGNVVARTVNGELVFYDQRGGGGAVSDGGGGQALVQSQPSWKDPETGMIIVPPATPDSPEEMEAVPSPTPAEKPFGFDVFVNQKRDEIYSQGQQSEVALAAESYTPDELRQRLNNQPQQTQAPTPPVETPKPEVQQPQQQTQPTLKNFQQQAQPKSDEFDMEDLRTKALSSFQDWSTARISADDRMKKNFEPMIEALNQPGVNPELRNRILNTHLNAYQYQGRDNEASSDLNGAEFQALMDNQQRISEGYGGKGSDGSAHNFDSIREFQQSINDLDLDDDLIKKSFNALSPAQQKIFKGGDMNAMQGYRKFLTQHFKDGYTGLPLDMNTMQMEHFIDNSQSVDLKNLAKKEGRNLTEEEQALVDFIASEDNQFWARQGPNEQKSSRNIKQFYDDRILPLKDLGPDFFDFREMKVNPARLNLKNQEKEFVGGLVNQDEGDDFRYLSEMDADQFNSHRDAVNQIYGNEKEQLLEALSQAFDKKDLMKMTPKKLQKAIDDASSDITEADRTSFDMLSNLKSKIKGYNPDFAYRLTQALGLPSNFIQSERARSTPVSPAIYDGLISQLAGKNKEQQREYLNKVRDVFGKAQTAANQGRGKGNKDEDIRNLLYSNMLQGFKDQGIFTDDMIKDTKQGTLGSLYNKFLQQQESVEMPMMDEEEEEPTGLQDIIDAVKEIIEAKKPEGRMNFEEFKKLKGWI